MPELNFNLRQDSPQLSLELENVHIVTTPIDDTLTESGAAADAKATGDAIRAITSLTDDDIDEAMEDAEDD